MTTEERQYILHLGRNKDTVTLVLEKYYHLLGMNRTIILQQNNEQCKAINVNGMGNMLND